jgi:hypothetical protein
VITAGQVVLVSGDDRMSGTLRSPVTHPSTGSIWPVDVAVQGKLASWTRRLTPVVGALPSLALDGQLQASVTGQWSASAVELDKSEITVQSLTVRGMGLFIDEPQARLVANGRWDANSGRLDLRQLSLETSAVAVQSRDSRLGLSAASAHETQGELSLDGNINKLTDWFRDPTQPRFWEVSGALHGRAVLTNQGGKAGAAIDLNAENVLATPRGSRQWHEPSIRLTAMTDYDAKADVLTISQSELKSEMLTLQCAGQIQPAGSTRQVQLEGHLSYDLAKVQRLLQPYTGTGLQLAGAKTTPFSVAGPLTAPAGLPSDQATTAWVRQFVGRGEIGWDWINAYGMQVGRGTLAMELRDGVLNCAPVDLAVGNGRVHLAPVVNLTSAATELQMPAGVVVDHVELSPEMCRQAVGYVAPLLAGVTQSQGEISLALDACRIPLAQPTTGDAIGRLTLHTVQVSSGPIIQEMASLIGTTAALQAKPDCEVQFRMVNGRVYHQGLELSMPGITLRTQGSVGFDQSLALLVDMPIPAQWLAQTGLTTQLQNQALRVPLAGTLSRPALDGGEVQRQLGQFLGRASSGLIENGINRGLQNLLGPTGGLMNNPKR